MDIQPLYDKKIKCHVCQYTYTTKNLRSRFIKTVSHDSDFCSCYQNNEYNPLLYHVHVCPNCGYACSDEFSSYFPFGTLELIKKNICNKWSSEKNYGGKRTYKDAIDTYKLSIYSGNLKKEKHIKMAGLHLRLAWLYRMYMSDNEQELRFLDLSFEEYLQSYQEGDYLETQFSELKLLYLIGELARRTNKEKQAVRFFSMVIERQQHTTERKVIELAQNQWNEIRIARQRTVTQLP